MSRVIIFLIKFYQTAVSPDHSLVFGNRVVCRFFPSCSEYAASSFEKYPVLSAARMSVRRVLRCHPFNKGGWDPAP